MSGSNDALTQMLLMQARQQRQPSMQARLAQQMMQANMQQAQTPVWGTAGTLARAGSGVLAGLMSGLAERDDRQREDDQLQRLQDRQDQREQQQRQELAAFLGGPQMPQQAPQMPMQGGGGMPAPASADGGVAASEARYASVPGRPPIGASYREPDWAAGLPPANGRINPLPLEGGSMPAAAPQGDAMSLYQRAVSSPNPLIRAMAPGFLAQANREDVRANRPPQIVSPGSTVFDTATNRPIFTAPRAPEAPDETTRLLMAGGLQPGTPEFQARALAIADRRAMPPQTNINTGDTPQAILARADVDTLKTMNEAANQMFTTRELFSRARQAIQNAPEGQGAQLVPVFGQLARTFGIDVPGTTEAEVLQSITARLAPAQRIAGSGATSDRDINLFLQAVPRLGRTRDGNLQILDMGERVANRTIEITQLWRRHAGQPDLIERINALPPIFSDEERQMLAGQRTNTGQTAPGGVTGPAGMTMEPPAPQQGGGWSIRPVR